MSDPRRDLAGRRVTVLGLGLHGGGAAATRFLVHAGARVTVTDLRSAEALRSSLSRIEGLDVELALGGHREEHVTEAELVVVNPAVPRSSRFIALARERGVPLTSEVALFLARTPARVIAITGTHGKSSTTSFLAQLLAAALPDRRVHLGGNIGRSLLDDVGTMTARDLVCLELSSYQLESLPEDAAIERAASPIEIGVVLNVLEDHLERHGTLEAYARAKLRLLELIRPGGHAFLPAGALPVTASLDEDVTRHEIERRPPREPDLGDLVDFQKENATLALRIAELLGAPTDELRRASSELRGLPHRLARVGTLDGRTVWDNGISTTVDSTLSALEVIPRGATVLLGGKAKTDELSRLIAALREARAHVVLFGAARARWAEPLRAGGLEVREAEGPREALLAALEQGAGDLLFSPACSSFDAYAHVIQRAEDFLACAHEVGLTPVSGGER